eukprot:936678-Rhodomonas_salina.2
MLPKVVLQKSASSPSAMQKRMRNMGITAKMALVVAVMAIAMGMEPWQTVNASPAAAVGGAVKGAFGKAAGMVQNALRLRNGRVMPQLSEVKNHCPMARLVDVLVIRRGKEAGGTFSRVFCLREEQSGVRTKFVRTERRASFTVGRA